MNVSQLHLAAALDNAALCAAMWRAHGLGVERVEGGIVCSGTPPRFYPNVVTVDPTIDAGRQTDFIAKSAERAAGPFSVKDSFRALALGAVGFKPLFDAQWIHRAASLDAGEPRLVWRAVKGEAELSAWEAAWRGGADGPTIFLPAFLKQPEVAILAGWAESAVVAGCVITETGAVAGLSNVFGDASEAIKIAAKTVSGRDLVGYETGEALAIALEAGFETVGDLTVWRRA